MKAVRLYKVGDLRVEDVPVPKLQTGEVLLTVKAIGVCGSDLPRVMHSGAHRMPVTIGHEFAGEIVAMGENTEGWAVGDKVTVAPLLPCYRCEWCQAGNYHLCANYDYFGSRRDGAMAEFVAVPVRNLVKLPNDADWESGAMCDPAATALHALWRTPAQVGSHVTLYGMGPIGLFAVQWAKLLGAQEIVAIDVWDDKLELASELGATQVINARREDPVARIEQLTDKRMSEVVIDFAGLQTTQLQAIRSTRRRGTTVFLGISHDDLHLPEKLVAQIMRHEIHMTGSWNSNSMPFPGKEWELTIDYFQGGRLLGTPLVSHRYSLDEAPNVFPKLYRREMSFNKVLFFP
ncbi:MAG: galactitol-1-phosphate 5-dehydrogenase [Caldilineaceae bacterium]